MNLADKEAMIIAAAVIAFLILIIAFIKKGSKKDYTKMYKSKNIMTNREYVFFKRLEPLARKYGLRVFTKVRLADLIEPKSTGDRSLWFECFNKIKSKHIDFALADKNADIVVLVELDDSTHERADRKERDAFVDAVLKNCGYVIVHTYGSLDEVEREL